MALLNDVAQGELRIFVRCCGTELGFTLTAAEGISENFNIPYKLTPGGSGVDEKLIQEWERENQVERPSAGIISRVLIGRGNSLVNQCHIGFCTITIAMTIPK